MNNVSVQIRPELSVSVVIPVKNGVETIRACIQGWLNQTHRPSEILVIDSGSTDGTREIAAAFSGVRIHDIPPPEFGHGRTRNLGVELAVGDLILFTVQDAQPVDERVLERLVAVLDHEGAAAACGVQIVRPNSDANPVEWHRSYSEPSPERLDQIHSHLVGADTPGTQIVRGWDNVLALYRRDALREIPFRNVQFGEDLYWMIDALRGCHRLVRDPRAQVHHYHHYGFKNGVPRAYFEHQLNCEIFKASSYDYNIVTPIIRATYLITRNPGQIYTKLYWIFYNIRLGLISLVALLRFQFDALVRRAGGNCVEQNVLGSGQAATAISSKSRRR